ncbi:MAG TPA: SDR family oxidoreductase [Candidatus Binataceae bacterium]|nr:SDR family oxidoreductase [Candidatus Binataceae bacterium]
MKLDGKIAIITGTSSNIGGGIAEGLAAEGAAIVCVDIKPENAADCAKAIEQAGGRALAAACDVTNEGEVKAVVAAARETYGGIDILVNGAAIFNQKGVLDMPLAEWERQIGIILTGTFLFTKYAAHSMIEQKRHGAIINIISSAGHQGQPNNVAYCTSKCGLLNFTRSVAMELVPHGIRVNSLTPTATDPSEGIERALRWGRKVPNAERVRMGFEPFRKRTPMQKLPSPRHYGRAAVFLASDDAEMMTGMDLRVDAGTVARYWAWDPAESPR